MNRAQRSNQVSASAPPEPEPDPSQLQGMRSQQTNSYSTTVPKIATIGKVIGNHLRSESEAKLFLCFIHFREFYHPSLR
jgi:hypothetical protein